MNANSRQRKKDRPWQQGSDQSASFGAWLRRQREAREISLREIADSSRISLRYLEAFEQDRFDVLPARVFAQGFLREYAKYVGLDPDEVVNHFLSAQQNGEPDEEAEEESRPRRARTNWLFNLVLIAAVVATLVLTALVAFNRERSRAREEAASPPPSAASALAGDEATGLRADEVPAPSPLPSEPVVSATAAPAASSPAPEGQPPTPAGEPAAGAEPALVRPGVPLRVVLRFQEACWAQVDVDGSRRVQREVPAGEVLPFDARELVVMTLGNAGGVEVLVNGRRFDTGRGRGQVARDVRIDLSQAAPASQPNQPGQP